MLTPQTISLQIDTTQNPPELLVVYDVKAGKIGSIPKNTSQGLFWRNQSGETGIFLPPLNGKLSPTNFSNCANCQIRIPAATFPKIGTYELKLILEHCINNEEEIVNNEYFIGPKFDLVFNRVGDQSPIEAGQTVPYLPLLSNIGLKPAKTLEVELNNKTEEVIQSISETTFQLPIFKPKASETLNEDNQPLQITFRPEIDDDQVGIIEAIFTFEEEGQSFTIRQDFEFPVGENIVLKQSLWDCEGFDPDQLTFPNTRVFQPGEIVDTILVFTNVGFGQTQNAHLKLTGDQFIDLNEDNPFDIYRNTKFEVPIKFGIPESAPDGPLEISYTIVSGEEKLFQETLCLLLNEYLRLPCN